MKSADISNLISIRNYVRAAVDNFSIDKETVKNLNSMVILIDKKIVSELMSDEFKDFIGFSGAKEAVKEAASINNIRKDMKPTIAAVIATPAGKNPAEVIK